MVCADVTENLKVPKLRNSNPEANAKMHRHPIPPHQGRTKVCHSVAPQIPIGRVTDYLDPWMNITPFMTESGSNYEPSTGHYDHIVAVREYNTAHV